MVQTTKLLGVFFLTADYFRYSLGFSQLASMAELALVIRESVKLVKIERQQYSNMMQQSSQRESSAGLNDDECDLSQNMTTLKYNDSMISEDIANSADQKGDRIGQPKDACFKRSLWAIYIYCTVCVFACLVSGTYFVYYTE